jgi:hypothetical protein
MSDLTTAIAGFGSLIGQSTPIRSSAIARDMAKLATSIAFHGLGLTIAGVMVWPTTLVASGSTRNTSISSTKTTSETTTATTMAARMAARSGAGSRAAWAIALECL